jgi:hypothetical protein
MNESEVSNSEKIGPLIGSVIIILIIIAGAFYLFSIIKQKVDTQKATQETITESTENQSDEISEIEADINSIEVENLDAELEALQVEFQI